MFFNLPFDLATHDFVTSGNLAIWAEYDSRLSYSRVRGNLKVEVDKDPKHSSNMRCFQSALTNKVLGTLTYSPVLPLIYSEEIKKVLTKSVSAAVESGRLVEIYLDDIADSSINDEIEYQLVQPAVEVPFCSEYLSLIRKLFVKQGVSFLIDADKFRPRQVLKYLVENIQISDNNYERHIRMRMKTKTRLHSILGSLSPFVYDSNKGHYYKKYRVNKLGIELYRAIERQFYSSVAITKKEVPSELNANQRLLLLALSRTACFDITDHSLFNLVISIITESPIVNGFSAIWDFFQEEIDRNLNRELNILLAKGFILRRDRENGEINNGACAYWLELTESGVEAAREARLAEQYLADYKNHLAQLAAQWIHSLEFKVRIHILKYACEMREKDNTWSEYELRTYIKAEKSMSAFIHSLYPLIVLDENHFGKGHKHKISDFGLLVFEKLKT